MNAAPLTLVGAVTMAVGLTMADAVATPAALAQEEDSSYVDPTARVLHEAAMAARERVDQSVVSYTAVVRQRIAAAIRMPLKDRTLYRSEASHRLWWNRDAENLVQILAFREQTPVGVDPDHVDFD
ncbi:MAG: hypothetical protein HKO77_08205, partial [Gemmatimonadetes bacterium]|nr:hypothetical protein [Gemmatimonadota bacterium]